MRPIHIQQQRRPPAISWVLAGMIGVAGAGLFAYGMYMKFVKPPPTVENTSDKGTDQIEKDIESSQKELAALREKGKPAVGEYEKLVADNKQLATTNETRTKKVRDMESHNRDQLDAAQKKIEAIKNNEKQDETTPDKTAAPKEDDDKALAKFQAELPKLHSAIVTVNATGGPVGTGFVFKGSDGPVIVTTTGIAAEGAEMTVKLRSGDDKKAKTVSLKARVLLADKDSGLSFLALEKDSDIKDFSFDASSVRGAQPGEKIFAIGTQVVNGEALDCCLLDGTVSATNRKFHSKTMLQVALPVNKGALGTPLITPDLKLIGILYAPVEDLERTSVAVSAKDMLKVLEKVPKK
ncbi:MAG TPA: trypsin-like peptidase domain-containing protein [Planctomycetota bacterium]|nr:trypsin-like peptidase domain-containing protein [Planctomycetota bacterium]